MTTTSHMGNRRILVIDDNAAIHEDFRKILADSAGTSALIEVRAALFDDVAPPISQEGFELDCADQGQTGLGMVQCALQSGRPYAVAFVDIGWKAP